MASEWYLMGSMPVYNSGYEQEEFDNYAKDSFSEILETSPIKKTIKIIKSDLAVISEIKAIVLNNVADSTSKSKERYILTSIGTLKCGDYILFEKAVWLITSLVGNNGMYEKSIMEYCNWTLKFQNESGTILSYPCITKSTRLDEESGKVITLGDNRKSILCTFDNETSKLKADKRLYVDRKNPPTPYIIIGDTDTTTYNYGDKGLIEFTVEQDTAENTTQYPDRPDLGVCNYREPSTPTPSGSTDVKINVDSLSIGMTTDITPTFYEVDGTVNNSIVAVWTITKPTGYETDISYSFNGNMCKIKITDNYDLLDKTVGLVVSDGNGGFIGTFNLTIGTGW